MSLLCFSIVFIACDSDWCPSGDCQRFYTYPEGSIYDAKTKLTWYIPTNDGDDYWSSNNPRNADGVENWRLPTIDELRTLISGNPEVEPGGDCHFKTEELNGNEVLRPENNADCLFSPGYRKGPGSNGCYLNPDLGIDWCGLAKTSNHTQTTVTCVDFLNGTIESDMHSVHDDDGRYYETAGHVISPMYQLFYVSDEKPTGQGEAIVSSSSNPYNWEPNAERYDVSDDGFVMDTETGLMWSQAASSNKYNYYEAEDWCESQTTGGYNDWRLPSLEELSSLVTGCPEIESDGLCLEAIDNYHFLIQLYYYPCKICGSGHIESPTDDGIYMEPDIWQGPFGLTWTTTDYRYSDYDPENLFISLVDFKFGEVKISNMVGTGNMQYPDLYAREHTFYARCVRDGE